MPTPTIEGNITESDLRNMRLHEIIVINQVPYFRVMRVSNGWLYNFYDVSKDDYFTVWNYVPIH